MAVDQKKKEKSNKTKVDQQTALVKTLGEISNLLIQAWERNEKMNISKVKHEVASRNRLNFAPKLTDIISSIPEDYKTRLLPLLKAKPVRTASGIAVVAVMSKPHRCPHISTTGNICIYCPGGPDSDFEYST